MRKYKLENLVKHLEESTTLNTHYFGHSVHDMKHSIEFLSNVAGLKSNNGYVPAFVVVDEFGGAVERIIASSVVSIIEK